MSLPDPLDGPARGHLRSRSWTRVSHGLYKPTTQVDGLRQDLAAWRLVLPPSGRFTHLTAAQVYGWWLPPLPPDVPVFASMSTQEHRPRRPGLRVSRHPKAPDGPQVYGLPLAEPAEVLLACARDLSLLDVVVLTEAALQCGSCTAGQVSRLAEARRYGAPRLRRALHLVDGRAESAWEVLLRVLHVVTGVRVVPQHTVLDDQGRFVARGDLWIEDTSTLHEYDGAHHREKARQRRDLDRDRRLGHAGWTRRGYTDLDVLTRAVAILRDADTSLGRPHRPERIRPWHRMLADSLFTPGGQASARRRWGLPDLAGHEPAVEARP